MRSVLLEVFGQPLLVVHGHGSSSWRVISGDPPTLVEVTGPARRCTNRMRRT
jgi:hypothetical protein